MGWKSPLRRAVNRLLLPAGAELVRASAHRGARGPDIQDFLPFAATLKAAKDAGMSLADYIDLRHARPEATQQTIDAMARLGVFAGRVERVCEIGAGSGRYLERTLSACQPSYYEVYEPAEEWRDWLVSQYKVTAQRTDGRSLSPTPTASIDLVQAHKVFVYTPFLTTCRYFAEMARVVRGGGHVVFDVITECCMDDETLAAWLPSDLNFPCLMAKQYTIRMMESNGLGFVGSFFIPLVRGKTECMVFARARSVDR